MQELSHNMRIELLGRLLVETDSGELLKVRARKCRALLVCLVVAGPSGVTRERLAQLLWSNNDLPFGKTNLRQCLSALRKDLQDSTGSILQSDGDLLCINPQHVIVDVWGLTESPQTAALKLATDFTTEQFREHGFGLLSEFPAIDPAFDEWLVLQRRRFHQLITDGLVSIVASHEQFGTPADALASQAASAILQIEPAHELAHTHLIRSLAARGDRQGAIRQYEHCVEALDQHLDAVPTAATTMLIKAIKADASVSPTRVANSASKSPSPLDETSELPVTPYHRAAFSLLLLGVGCLLLIASIRGWLPYATNASDKLPVKVLKDTSAAKSMHASVGGGIETEGQPRRAQDAPGVADGDIVATVQPQHQGRLAVQELPTAAVLADRVSLAVLPFRNLAEDETQQYLSDGLSDDLVTELSRISGLRVVASYSSFAFRGNSDPGAQSSSETMPGHIKVAADTLSVDYLLTGSLRRVENRLRISAHLISTSDATYLWTERFDRELGDVLQVQDEIARQIVASMAVELTEPEWRRLSTTRHVSADAYDMLLRGLHPFSQFTPEGISEARDYFKRAIALDSRYARPYANMALSYGREVVFNLINLDKENIESGLRFAETAQRLDPALPQTQFARAVLLLAMRDHPRAVAAAKQAIALDSNYADGYAVLAQTLSYQGKLDEALEAIAAAKYLNPLVPFTYHWVEGHILFQLGRLHDAEALLASVYERNPSFYTGLLTLAAIYGQLGKLDQADWIVHEILMHNPGFSIEAASRDLPYELEEHRQRFQNGLEKAGLPG